MMSYGQMTNKELEKLVEIGKQATLEMKRREVVGIELDVEVLNDLLKQVQEVAYRITERADQLADAGIDITYTEDLEWLRGAGADFEKDEDSFFIRVAGY